MHLADAICSKGKASDLPTFKIERNKNGVPLFPDIDIWKIPVDDVAKVLQDYITELWSALPVSL
jgi:hypothetical protein